MEEDSRFGTINTYQKQRNRCDRHFPHISAPLTLYTTEQTVLDITIIIWLYFVKQKMHTRHKTHIHTHINRTKAIIHTTLITGITVSALPKIAADTNPINLKKK